LPKKLKITNKLTAKILAAFLLISMLTLVFITKVSAEPTISLSINRIGPGANIGSDMNGMFTVSAQVSSDVARVEFYLNGTLQANDTTAPFSWTADSNDYPLGSYNITGVAFDSTGHQAVYSFNENFIEMPMWTIIPLIVLLIVIFLGLPIFYIWYSRKGYDTTKCPKCGYDYAQKILFVHIGPSNLKRCPNCGKFFFRGKPYNPSDNDDSPPPDSPSDEDRLRKDIDKSKYEN
jgi:uncharacterized C2H2 Zn-finger protein